MTLSNNKVRRNEPCPCGSGRKYKNCCLKNESIQPNTLKELYLQQYKIHLKEKTDIEGIRKTGQLALETLKLVESQLKSGMTTNDINTIVHDFTIKNGAKSAPLNYRGFPKSVCVSVNEVICHGIPGERIINDGDIVNVDVTPILNGYYADVNRTFFIGKPDKDAEKIVNVSKGSLKIGMQQVKPGNTIGDIGWAIKRYAEGEGCSVVREYVGHGVGFEFHEAPQVAHYGNKGKGIELVPGMVFTVEPMINMGNKDVKILKDGWTAVTADGSLSAQFEQTILVTEDGYESLTSYDL